VTIASSRDDHSVTWRRGALVLLFGFALAVSAPTFAAACPSGWSVASVPPDSGRLLSVAASSPSDAWAVGSKGDKHPVPLALHWDGRRWQQATVPSRGAGVVLRAIALVPETRFPRYWAVGNYLDPVSGVWQPYVVRWDGRRWRQVPTPKIPAGGYLAAVRAFRGGDVWVGGSKNSLPNNLANESETLLLHRRDRSWTLVPTNNVLNDDPSLVGDQYYGLINGISALEGTASNDLWSFRIGGDVYPDAIPYFADRWDGNSWETTYPSGEILDAVSLSRTSLWAVGWGWSNTWDPPNPTLAAHWDGKSWQTIPTPNSATGPGDFDELAGVAAISERSVWAVGFAEGYPYPADGPFFRHVLVEQWDGRRWSVVAARLAGLTGRLSDVTNIPGSDRELWAVGELGRPPGGLSPLIVRRC
jgi:hypothetical protein